MAREEQYSYQDQAFGEVATRIRDLEERNRTLRDRLILIGQNLVETKEKQEKQMLEVKKDLEIIKKNFERMNDFIETLSGEFSNFARKEDLEILQKQAKMFQPLETLKNK